MGADSRRSDNPPAAAAAAARPLPHRRVTLLRRLRFDEPATERAYLRHHADAARPFFRATAAIGLFGWCLIAAIDGRIAGDVDNARVALIIRFVVGAPVIVFGLAWSFVRTDLYRRTHEWVMVAVLISTMGCVAAMMLLVPHPEVYSSDIAVAGEMLLIMVAGTLSGLRFPPAMVAIGAAAALVLNILAFRYRYAFWPISMFLLLGAGAAVAAGYLIDLQTRRAWLVTRELAHERERSEALLRNILPESIAERLKRGPARIADHFPTATVLFADLVGFTAIAERTHAEELVSALDELFSTFDAIAEQHGLEKIKTIGDAYMVVGGVPTAREDHARAVAEMALAMRTAVGQYQFVGGRRMALRIGIATGPVIAGVIGRRKLVYDLWGDTVNTASRMESHGIADGIQITDATRALLADDYVVAPRGSVSVKGKGEMNTWLLIGPRDH